LVCLHLSIEVLKECEMNLLNYKLCDKIIPASYVRQGLEARKVLENRVMQLLEQACIVLSRIHYAADEAFALLARGAFSRNS